MDQDLENKFHDVERNLRENKFKLDDINAKLNLLLLFVFISFLIILSL